MALGRGYKQTEVGMIPEDWRCTTVSGIASPIRNAVVGGPFGSNLVSTDYVGDGVPVIRGQNLSSRYVSGPFVFVTREKADSLAGNLAYPGDLIFTQRGTLGQVSILPDRPYDCYLVSQSQMKVTVNDKIANQTFLYYVFNSSYHQSLFHLNTIQTGVPHINLGILRSIPVQLPPLPEQQAIAAALSDVDALLASLDALIAKKRLILQGAMQELLTGRRRLPGFSGEWGIKALGEIGECIRGVSYNGDVDLFPYDTEASIRLLRSNNVQNALVVLDDIQFVYHVRVSEKQLLCPGDILICMANGSKELVGKAGWFNVDDGLRYTFGAFMGCFRIEISETDPYFVFYNFQTSKYRNCILNLLTGSSINNLRPDVIEAISIPFPSLKEQSAIASILSDMDAEIHTLEQRRDKTRQIKQGMMQELLSGRTRLV